MKRPIHALFYMQEIMLQLEGIIRLTSFVEIQMSSFFSLHICQISLQFAGIGKQSSWSIFVTCPRLLQHLEKDESPEEKVLCDAEAFICQLYNKGTEETFINRERASAFRRAKKSLDSLPRAVARLKI